MAFVYDGTEKMALQIDNNCKYSSVKYNECGTFVGLYGYTYNGLRMKIPELIIKGDYLIRIEDLYILMNKSKFEEIYDTSN